MLVTPILAEQDSSREALLSAMWKFHYPHAAAHEEIFHNATVFTCCHDDDLAGFIWFYRLLEDESIWSTHVLVVDNYQKRFWSRCLIDSIFGCVYCLGCRSVRVEGDSIDFAIRLGADLDGDRAHFQLPFIWRKKHGRSHKQCYQKQAS